MFVCREWADLIMILVQRAWSKRLLRKIIFFADTNLCQQLCKTANPFMVNRLQYNLTLQCTCSSLPCLSWVHVHDLRVELPVWLVHFQMFRQSLLRNMSIPVCFRIVLLFPEKKLPHQAGEKPNQELVSRSEPYNIILAECTGELLRLVPTWLSGMKFTKELQEEETLVA